MKNTVLLFLTAVCCVMLACQPAAVEEPPVDLNALKAEIQAMEDAYAKAQNEKNADALLAYYADDAQRLPDGEPIEKGKDAIRKAVMEDMASDTSGATVRFEILDLFAAGNLLVEVGASMTTAKDGTVERGKYIVVFEKRDGKYICIREIWNDDTDDDDDAEDTDEAGDDAED